jgi:hypothetical protein
MQRVRVWAEVADQHFYAYEREARRKGVPVEDLIQQTVNCLLRELEAEERTGCVEERATGVS